MSDTDKPKEVRFEAIQRELERLRKENAELRRLLGVTTVEPTLNFHARSEPRWPPENRPVMAT